MGDPAVKTATDAEGRLRFNGFLGDYKIVWQNREVEFALVTAGEQRLALELD